MSRATFIIASDAQRHEIIRQVRTAPWNTRVELKAPRRTLPQNDRMHAMLTSTAGGSLRRWGCAGVISVAKASSTGTNRFRWTDR